MHRLTDIQECLISMVECQMANPDQVNTEELGEVIDMIKDISETKYYCTKELETKQKYENMKPFEMTHSNTRDEKSSQYRKMYMDSKELHKPAEEQIHDLREYLKELSEDITEMVAKATKEEKVMLQNKLIELSKRVIDE